MMAQIEIEGKILEQKGNIIICEIGRVGIKNVLGHIWIAKGKNIEEFKHNPAINSKAGLLVGPNGALKLY